MSSASSSRLTPAVILRTLAALGTSLLKGMSRAPFNTSFDVDVTIGSNLRDGWGSLSPHIVPSERPTPVSSSSAASRGPTLKWKGSATTQRMTRRNEGERLSRPQVSSGHLIEQALGLELHVKSGVLPCLGAGEGRDALHKI